MNSNNHTDVSLQNNFSNWIVDSFGDAGYYIVIITFKGRIRASKLSSSQVHHINDGYLSEKHTGRDFSKSEIERGFNEFMKQLDYKYLPTSMRKKGIRLKVCPCTGGDSANGTYNHVHAYIQLPNSVSFEDAKSYMKKIAQNKMEKVCKSKGRIETDVWCVKTEFVDPRFINYMTRLEGDVEFKLDKVMLNQMYL